MAIFSIFVFATEKQTFTARCVNRKKLKKAIFRKMIDVARQHIKERRKKNHRRNGVEIKTSDKYQTADHTYLARRIEQIY